MRTRTAVLFSIGCMISAGGLTTESVVYGQCIRGSGGTGGIRQTPGNLSRMRRPFGNTGMSGLAALNALQQMNSLNMTARPGNTMSPRISGPGTPSSGHRQESAIPTVGQFVQAAMAFDHDGDHTLNHDELTEVAAAVIRELQAQQTHRHRLRPSRRTAGSRSSRSRSPGSSAAMQNTFVRRALTFDANGDGRLNRKETARMARALIRSLNTGTAT